MWKLERSFPLMPGVKFINPYRLAMKKKWIVPGILFVFTLGMISCNPGKKTAVALDFHEQLVGKWVAPAFEGELREEWTLGKDGWLWQQGFYITEQDTAYRAQTKIEKVSGKLILFSIIADANPKIFQADSLAGNTIVFRNTEYINPATVTYEFISDNHYRRTIKGTENDSIVVYEFNFKKVLP